MTVSILAIRPEPGLSSTIEAGAKAGLTISGHPLFAVEPVNWDAPSAAQFDGLLVGSANVFRHAGEQLAIFRELPVLAVGAATAAAAERAGFRVEQTGSGGLQSLIDEHVGGAVHWLRLAGEEHVPLTLPAKIQLTTLVVYRVQTSDFDEEMIESLRCKCLVLLHSAAAARHFTLSCDAHDVDRSRIALAALGPRILEPVGQGWLAVRSAASPHESALMALAKEMCETF